MPRTLSEAASEHLVQAFRPFAPKEILICQFSRSFPAIRQIG